MLSWLSKKASESDSANKPSARHGTLISDVRDAAEARVTYASRDRQRDVQFVAHLPTGSRLASEAQEVIGHIYAGTTPHTGDQRLLGGQSRPTKALEYDKAERHQGRKSEAPPTSSAKARPYGNKDIDAKSDIHSSIGPDDSVSSVGRQGREAPRGGGAGFRKQSMTHTTHYVEGNGRQLYVSAPNGSQEARVFDEVAARANIANEKVRIPFM